MRYHSTDRRSIPNRWLLLTAIILVGVFLADDAFGQRGRSGGRAQAGNRSAGHRSANASRSKSRGPSMSRSGPSRSTANRSRPTQNKSGVNRGNANRAAGNRGAANRPGGNRAGNQRTGNAGQNRNRGNASTYQRPGGRKPGQASGNRPANRPTTGGGSRGPGGPNRPSTGRGASSKQLDEFLGTKQTPSRPAAGNRDRRPPQPGNRPGADGNRPGDNRLDRDNRSGDRNNVRDRDQIGDRNNIGDRNRNNIGDRNNRIGNERNSREVNVGDVNIGNSVNYQDNRQAWVDNRHRVGNDVRVNAGNRYANSYRDGIYRRGITGGYAYTAGWASRGGYYGWQAPTFAAVGGFLGASFANAQPIYYGYGDGGNVYYEQNTVYVDGQPAGTPEEYAQQAYDYVAAAPPAEDIDSEDWLPLGVFAFTREDVADSQAMIELAVDKQGVLAGTYYNEETGVSRPLKGTVDAKSQRAVVGFADDADTEVALETGIYNLTKDEAPALLHRGMEESQPVLLVRLPAPEEGN